MATNDNQVIDERTGLPMGLAPSVDIPMVRVLDENGKEIRRGYYVRWVKRQPCAFGDYLQPEDVSECVVFSGFADWNMPREMQVMVIEPPLKIELLPEEERDWLA